VGNIGRRLSGERSEALKDDDHSAVWQAVLIYIIAPNCTLKTSKAFPADWAYTQHSTRCRGSRFVQRPRSLMPKTLTRASFVVFSLLASVPHKKGIPWCKYKPISNKMWFIHKKIESVLYLPRYYSIISAPDFHWPGHVEIWKAATCFVWAPSSARRQFIFFTKK